MFLSRILEAKRQEVVERSSQRPLSQLRESARGVPDPRDFLRALRQPGLAVIAEIKRASPSRGPLRPDLDPSHLAREYEAGGCAALSVLTDGPFFGAQPEDLERARAAVRLPVLRKDFLIDEYQLWESKVMGADALLLIVAALEMPTLARLVRLAGDLGLCPLVEVHTEAEVESALAAGARVIGINNRDLATFQVSVETTRRLRPLIPPDITVVSESGISGPREASLVRSWGVDAVLVGEALVRSGSPEGLIRAIRESSNPATDGQGAEEDRSVGSAR